MISTTTTAALTAAVALIFTSPALAQTVSTTTNGTDATLHIMGPGLGSCWTNNNGQVMTNVQLDLMTSVTQTLNSTVIGGIFTANGNPVNVNVPKTTNCASTASSGNMWQFTVTESSATSVGGVAIIEGVTCVNGQFEEDVKITFHAVAPGTTVSVVNKINNGNGGTVTNPTTSTASTSTSTTASITSTSANLQGGNAGAVTSTTTTTTSSAAATTTAANLNGGAAGACTVLLPKNPLSATTLSSAWTVSGNGCIQDGAATSMQTFAECAIYDTATGALSMYSPLLTNANQPHVDPVKITLTATSVVGCWFGTNGVSTTLIGDLAGGNCVNGLGNGDIFGQFASCNGKEFFAAVNAGIQKGIGTKPAIPPLGMGTNGKPCYTTRSFELIDMDPSDNMVTTYIIDAKRKIAQKTAANLAAMPNAQDLNNGSDNILLDAFVRPALGCTAFTAPNAADPGAMVGGLALNELQAAAFQAAPLALVPPADPMVLTTNGAQPSVQKQNLYRAAVNQPAAQGGTAEQTAFCQNMLDVTSPSILQNIGFYQAKGSPAPNVAKDLYTFMGQRLAMSWTGLGCQNLVKVQYLDPKQMVPIIANMDGNGVTQSLTANTAALKTIQQNAGGALQAGNAGAVSPTGTSTSATATATTGAAQSTVTLTIPNGLSVVLITANA